MRIAIISDVHANLEALEAALNAIRKEKPDALWFLGDIVGYGPNPNECLDVLKKEGQILLAGNHDWSVIGLTDIEYFNPNAREAIEWTIEVLSDKNKAFLKTLPILKSLKIEYDEKNPPLPPFGKRGQEGFLGEDILLVHSSPKEPAEWHYILNTWDAYINFQFFTEKTCLIGHSHHPFIMELNPEDDISIYKERIEFKENCRYIINVGSVGQPRDGNPDAAYAILDKNSVEIKRVSYDILSTQKKMREAGLPSFLIERLARGR